MTPLFYVSVALVAIVAALLLVILHLLDVNEQRRTRDGAQPMPTRRQLRAWRRDRLDLNPALRGRW